MTKRGMKKSPRFRWSAVVMIAIMTMAKLVNQQGVKDIYNFGRSACLCPFSLRRCAEFFPPRVENLYEPF